MGNAVDVLGLADFENIVVEDLVIHSPGQGVEKLKRRSCVLE